MSRNARNVNARIMDLFEVLGYLTVLFVLSPVALFIAGFDALSLLDAGMIVLGVEAAVVGAFFIAKPETMVRFYRRFNETRPVYRRMMSPPPIDVQAARSMGVGYFVGAVACLLTAWLAR